MARPGCYNGTDLNFVKTTENIPNQLELFLILFSFLRFNLCYQAAADQTFLNYTFNI